MHLLALLVLLLTLLLHLLLLRLLLLHLLLADHVAVVAAAVRLLLEPGLEAGLLAGRWHDDRLHVAVGLDGALVGDLLWAAVVFACPLRAVLLRGAGNLDLRCHRRNARLA